MKPNQSSILRDITRHASPILVAQLASMSTAIVDTLITARINTVDLAAVGIGAGLYISVMLAGAGVVQGLTPIAAHHVGAKRFKELPATLQQGLWLCLALALLGSLILATPDWLLTMNDVSPEVAERTRAYLAVLALALPGTLIYRACGGMLNALGHPRMLMFFGLGNAISHALLAPVLAFGYFGLPALGAVGCAASVALNTSLMALLALVYLARSQVSRDLRLLRNWSAPRWALLSEHLKLGLPIGMSMFVEMSSFALIGLLVAGLGAEAVGANRLLGNFAGTCYMLPLSISIATLSLVGQAAGAQDWSQVRRIARAGMMLGCAISVLVGLGLWLLQTPLVHASVPDPAVRSATLGLVWLIALYQLVDAAQTIAAQALRGLKITTLPMLVHVFSFWCVGLAGGWWLCYHGIGAMGISAQGLAGFWQAGVASSGVAALLFTALLWKTLRRQDGS